MRPLSVTINTLSLFWILTGYFRVH